MFVLVVGERPDLLTSAARALFDLLDAPKQADAITVVGDRAES